MKENEEEKLNEVEEINENVEMTELTEEEENEVEGGGKSYFIRSRNGTDIQIRANAREIRIKLKDFLPQLDLGGDLRYRASYTNTLNKFGDKNVSCNFEKNGYFVVKFLKQYGLAAFRLKLPVIGTNTLKTLYISIDW